MTLAEKLRTLVSGRNKSNEDGLIPDGVTATRGPLNPESAGSTPAPGKENDPVYVTWTTDEETVAVVTMIANCYDEGDLLKHRKGEAMRDAVWLYWHIINTLDHLDYCSLAIVDADGNVVKAIGLP